MCKQAIYLLMSILKEMYLEVKVILVDRGGIQRETD